MSALARHGMHEKLATSESTTHKMPGHWILARMGKRVLRPGGLQLTHQLLDDLDIRSTDDVVEFAPGLGVTTRLTLARNPASYVAVERDAAAAETVRAYLTDARHRCITGSAEETGLPLASASVVYGEAMLSMHPASTKVRIVREAARLLRPDGRYGIHELCLVPNDVADDVRQGIQRDLSDEIHVGVRPLTVAEWREILEAAGLEVVSQRSAPMHLLEPRRLVQDEGLLGATRFLWNVATHADARKRVLRMRRIFRKYRSNLAAVAFVSHKPIVST
ncbi:MAG TPA: class I SAM-dependent methyltransferase [Lacipirellulaceae bacterium]